MAPPRRPTRAKELAGTIRADRSNPNEPKPEPCILPPPDFVTGAALVEWERITVELDALSIVSALDHGVLIAYCMSYGEMVDATKEWQLLGSPMTTKSVNGIEMVHPLKTIVGQSREQMRKFANELGASPAGRSKVSAAPKPKELSGAKDKGRFFK